LESIKNPFGMGWEGFPDNWEHILDAVLTKGFQTTQKWVCYWVIE
jgi:hypothetical protein